MCWNAAEIFQELLYTLNPTCHNFNILYNILYIIVKIRKLILMQYS